MTRTELEAMVAEKTGLPKQNIATVIAEAFTAIKASLSNGDPVRIQEFGTFELTDVAAKTGRNPRTGETIAIPEHRKVRFKPGSALKDAVAKPAAST